MCYHAALRYSSVSTIMKFPGKRKSKHYFPVNARDPLLQQIQPEQETNASWVVGIDQTLVDIEAKVDDDFITRYGLSAGHSLVIEDEVAEAVSGTDAGKSDHPSVCWRHHRQYDA